MSDDLLSPRPSTPAHDHLAGLNEEQRLAVETTEGPLLILAGAGTGKTRVLTTRFAHILLEGLAWPEQILAVTFTNKAAREMRERVSAILEKPVEGLWLGTFHSLCARMLRQHAPRLGLDRQFTILDADDQLRLLKQIMVAEKIDLKSAPPPQLLHHIQLWKDRALLPEDITAAHDVDFMNGRARHFYALYQTRLKELSACDFGDLMLHMVTIFRRYPEVLTQYHRRFRYILVDEYQDTNTIQYLWLRLLAKRDTQQPANIACVGDDDQSIYSWRGAEIANILRFEKDFPGAKVIRLERNYRSTPRILSAASGVIAHNEGRMGKTLRPGLEGEEGERISVINTPDSDDEARVVAETIRSLHGKNQSYGDMAILIRAGFQTRPFEESLMRSGIPYQVIGGMRFYERAEIRDGTAYMRALAHPADDLAFERIINVPKRGVGNIALSKLRQNARDRQLPLQATLQEQLAQGMIKGKAAATLSEFMACFDRARETLAKQGHVVAVEQLLEESGYLTMWREDQRSVEAAGRLDNLREMLRAIGEFATLEEFLEHIALVMDSDQLQNDTNRVSLMTLHAAKGLEFKTVFLPGWEEGLFPSQRSLDEGGQAALEEERRLAYVGLTRARERAFILHATSRRIYANWQDSIPSRFIDELPDEHVHVSEPTRKQNAAFGKSFWRRSQSSPASTTSFSRPLSVKKQIIVPLGATVKHSRFGEGVVLKADGERLTVNFEEAGMKTIMANFVEVVS
ncbi:UvrD-helicase domain-containing protein [Saccharibacter sp. 17.LH.SD]|uniref:ATP-dependent helicase n=1 Tax=Saccharibacter sp. 17.LH.SD TaxID=2689393 RepID=UPI001367BB15|nr:UvrD-helicase domain-containing protein [Saccharibacter sp. 17.LH.SD]